MVTSEWNQSRKTCPECVHVRFTLVLASGEGRRQ